MLLIGKFCVRLRAVPLQSVESKLGRTGESELAERETGQSLLPSFPWAFARFARFPRQRDHPEGLLAVQFFASPVIL